ncbi:MAG: [Fe-Fe] hydrogenase large subunit C-terminal domain-containing protein [Candidatus Shapirobacteria bacterium]|jgi:iron only hydrogenase large subunit-like protein
MNESQTLTELLKNGSPLVAMLAPSFPIVFNPKTIVGQLKRAGFQQVVEISVGAKRTNEMIIEALKKDETSRFIASPCPNIVRMIRTKFPEAVKYLALSADSPMVATTRIVIEKFSGKRPVFIGPCLVKRLEAAQDYPELNILCITYRDLQQIFADLKIEEEERDKNVAFDLSGEETRLYPISGGLAQSSGVRDLLSDDDIEVVSGAKNAEEAVKRFLDSDHLRLLDILFCEGGCISGPGIDSPLTLEERRKKVTDYWNRQVGQLP